jgi:hypothetical protein
MSLFYKEGLEDEYKNGEPKMANIFVVLSVAFIGIVVLWMAIIPRYSVWQQGLAGQAELRRAEQNRQIKIEEAKAELESATLKADAEIERAKGVAGANDIIADGLKGNEEYLRYLYIQSLNDLDTQLIYVPTEAGLPILEANRR